MRHVITGGSGFTGRYLAAALVARGERVLVFDSDDSATTTPGTEFIRGDIREAGDLSRLHLDNGDVVYHLAARQFHAGVPRQNRDSWFSDVNVLGTQRLLEAMSTVGAKRLILFSTDMTYGIPDYTPVASSHPQRPIGPYGRSKVAAEALLVNANREFGLRPTIFRPRLISGAGRLGILSKLFRLIKAGLPVPLIGSGNNRYQMIGVEDCVTAALAAVDKDFPAGPFNLGSDNPPTIKELLTDLIARAGTRSIVLPTPAKPLQMTLSLLDKAGLTLLYPEQFAIAHIDYVLDTSETKKALNWTPKKSDMDIIFNAYTAFARS